ncbi:PspC domain-containing protein [Streptomyces sp. NPDC057877]|uniref:PspC domain-containing protein n=1 Tax=Streptomyces sp. NPDC057877 TaxID=3346269 RepID=UPI00369C38EA
MTDHQHAADAVPEAGPPSDAAAAAAAGEEPRAHERARTERTSPGPGGTPGPGGAPGPSGTSDPGGAPDPRGTAAEADMIDAFRKFRRERPHKMLAGVCSGLGRRCDMDPVIFRITLAVLSATGGIGLIFYGFAWLFVPYEDEEENEVRKLLTGRVDGQALAAVLFALVGCGVFLSMLHNGGVLTFAVVLSLLLAGAGYWSQHRDAPDADPLAAQAAADAPPEPQAPPVPAAHSSWWRGPIVKDGTHVGGTGYLWGPPDSRDRDMAAAVNIARGTSGAPWAPVGFPRPQPPKPRGPRGTGGWIVLLALLTGALGTALTWEEHPLGTSLQTGLSGMLIVLGLGVALSAFLGRTGAGSIFLAIITAGLLGVAAALPKDISTQWISTTWEPTAVSEVRPKYELGTGVGTLDLSGLDLPKGRTLTTGGEVGLGRLWVIVPKDATVKVTIEVGVGDIQLPGEKRQDVDVQPGRYQETTLKPPRGAGDEGGTIDLDLEVGMGQVEVSRAAS